MAAEASREERRVHRKAAKKQARSENDQPPSNLVSILSPECVTTQPWTPLSSSAAQRDFPTSLAPFSASSVLSLSSYASMISGASTASIYILWIILLYNTDICMSYIAYNTLYTLLFILYSQGCTELAHNLKWMLYNPSMWLSECQTPSEYQCPILPVANLPTYVDNWGLASVPSHESAAFDFDGPLWLSAICVRVRLSEYQGSRLANLPTAAYFERFMWNLSK